jgi:hypothetical protein
MIAEVPSTVAFPVLNRRCYHTTTIANNRNHHYHSHQHL